MRVFKIPKDGGSRALRKFENIYENMRQKDRLCGLVVRVSGYRYRGPGFNPRRYQIL